MNSIPSLALRALLLSVGLLAAAPVQAASLQQVNDWGASGVPGTASMYIYVPDNVAPNPPILVVAHYCGGTAGNVFGQAQSGGIVAAADQYGFIMVLPQTTNNCWDVGSTKSLTHDGGGETQAVAQMVEYAIAQYGANADRVYITGDSSGAMMTEAMLAVYPDVFKGGSSFAGVPAGCWAVGDPDGSWSSQCAGGQVTHTGPEWGDIARAMYPEYMGHRPRVQIFHGDADGTINYNNHKEAIKQWTDLLGLSADPTSTDTVMLGSHQATREQWTNACGYVVLEAYTSQGGDHGPSDAIFNASFVVPFLALDNTDAVDPEIAQCGSSGAGGATGTGGAPSTAGAGGSAGSGQGGVNAAGGSGGATLPPPGGAGGAGGAGPVANVPTGGMPGGGQSSVPAGPSATPSPVAGGVAGAGMTGVPTATPPTPVTSGTPTGVTPSAPSAAAPGATPSAAGSTPVVVPSATGTEGSPSSDASPNDGGCACSAVGSQRTPAVALFSALSLLAAFSLWRRRARVCLG